ncbi:MAG: FctA domain-containing protein [Atopobiaceae bacterium]|nr:FctA domain-containing protein [Atopobiaceae bacterium]
MLGKYRKKWAAVACSLLTALSLGMPAVALAAEDDSEPVGRAKLTKVINAPRSDQATHAENDIYTFTFTSEGVTQEDGVTSDEVPEIKNLVIHGVDMENATTSNINNGLAQSVVAANLSYILGIDNSDSNLPYSGAPARDLVKFPHAGVYTYTVSETKVDMNSGYMCLNSAATYELRVIVSNSNPVEDVTHDADDRDKLIAELVTVKQLTDDYGDPVGDKVDPTDPPLDNSKQKIINPDPSDPDNPEKYLPAGDDSGCLVEGFTFGNRYIKGGGFVIEKKVEGDYGDKTKLFHYTLTITDQSAKPNAALTYAIDKGEIAKDAEGHIKDDGIIDYAPGAGRERCFKWKENDGGTVNPEIVIEFTLRDGGTFAINGLWGFPIDSTDPSAEDGKIREKLGPGPNAGTMFTVVEDAEDHYEASAVVYKNVDATYKSDGGITHETAGINKEFSFTDYTGGEGTHTYVVNEFDDDSISLTGIFINNLPYILMIGVPLVVFAVMFARRRRASATAA